MIIFGMAVISVGLFLNACIGEEPTPQDTNSDTVLDSEIFTEATATKNLARCGKILDTDKSAECEQAVKDLILTDQAVAQNDASLCKEIKDERYKENCESRIERLLNEEKEREKIAEEKERIIQGGKDAEAKAFEKNDPNLCNTIEDDNLKYACRFNVIVDQAIAAGSASKCDEIGEQTFEEECKNNVNSEDLD